MSRRGRLLVAVGAPALGCIARPAYAAPIAYEPFDYTTGSLEAKGTDDAQWAGPWTYASSAATKAVVSGSLDHAHLAETGNKACISGTNGNATVWRKMDAAFSSGSVYIGFLAQIDTASERKWGLTLGNHAASWSEYPIRIGFPAQTNNGGLCFGVGDDSNYGFTQVPATSVALIVAKVVISGSSASTSLWAYPSSSAPPTSEPAAAMANATNSHSINIAFNAIELFSGGPASPLVSQTAYFDELRIGTSWSDVVVGAPEPGALALAGFGGVCLALRRRRRPGRYWRLRRPPSRRSRPRATPAVTSCQGW